MVYTYVIVWILNYNHKEKSEWEQYWDGVFERNRNNNN